MKTTFFTTLLVLLSLGLFAQVSINTDGTDPDGSAMLDVKSTDKGFLPPRVDLDDASTVAPLTGTVTAGMIIYNEGGDEADGLYMWNGTAWTKLNNQGGSHYVGELYQGGVVFWVDHTGEHGLIVSMVDQSTSKLWSDISMTLLGTTNDWDGESNTTAITGQVNHTTSAAKLCEDYTNANYGTGIYSDWYLPSRTELYHIWNSLYEVHKAIDTYGNSTTTLFPKRYWSSTEYHANAAFFFNFYGGYAYDFGHDSKTKTYRVRAIRAF